MSHSSPSPEQDAFLRAYDEYADAVFRFCLLKVSNREVALDIMQDTFTKTWEYVARGNTVENWRAFLYRSANNLIIDHYRKHKSASLDEMQDVVGFSPVDETMNSEMLARVKEAHRAIAQLPDEQRAIVTLRFVDDLQPKEIASILNMSTNVVSVRLHRGIKKLQQILKERKQTLTT